MQIVSSLLTPASAPFPLGGSLKWGKVLRDPRLQPEMSVPVGTIVDKAMLLRAMRKDCRAQECQAALGPTLAHACLLRSK